MRVWLLDPWSSPGHTVGAKNYLNSLALDLHPINGFLQPPWYLYITGSANTSQYHIFAL